MRTSSNKGMLCRMLLLLLVAVISICAWQRSILQPIVDVTSFSDSSFNVTSAAHNTPASNFSIANASLSEFWERNNEQIMDDILSQVFEEIDKAKRQELTQKTVLNTSNSPSPAPPRNSSSLESFQAVGPSLHSLLLSRVSRLSLEEFSAVGLASIYLRRLHHLPAVHSCAWVPKATSTLTASSLAAQNHSTVIWCPVSLRFVNETRTTDIYDVIILTCSFGQPIGANAEGGVLVLNMTSSFTPARKFDYVPVFQESADDLTSIPFEGPFKFEYAYCSPPIHSNMSERYVQEWFTYHQRLWGGRIHYLVYDSGGVDTGLLGVFEPLMKKGLLTVVDFRETSGRLSESSQTVHRLMINDCLQRTRFIARWTFSWEFDEYFQMVNSRVKSLETVLRMHESAPWISLGNMIWSGTYCRAGAGEESLAVEKMCFRLRSPTCGDERRANTCHGVEGQRKWIANPRKVLMGTVHRTLQPEWSGVILDARVARLNHYVELTSGSSEKTCWIVKNLTQVDELVAVDGWWWKDVSLCFS